MYDTRSEVPDTTANRENPVGHAVGAPFVDVYVLVAHPPDSTSFVVGAFSSPEEAEEARADLAGKAPAEVLSYQVDLSEKGRRRGW